MSRPWQTGVPEPFASNHDFWTSVAASTDALITVVLATVLTVVFGAVGSVAFVLPAVLLARAWVTGRRSGRSNRTAFATLDEWRDAERHAVAHVLLRAVVRPRHLGRAG